MSKATIQNVQDEGFRAEQFGGEAAFDFDAFLTALVGEAGRWAQAKVGATLYAATTADSYAFDCLARAETCFAASRLWKRRAGFHDSSAQVGREGGQYLERREYLAHADAAMNCANAALADALRELGVDVNVIGDAPAMASGYIETGRFAVTSAAPLNG